MSESNQENLEIKIIDPQILLNKSGIFEEPLAFNDVGLEIEDGLRFRIKDTQLEAVITRRLEWKGDEGILMIEVRIYINGFRFPQYKKIRRLFYFQEFRMWLLGYLQGMGVINYTDQIIRTDIYNLRNENA